MQNQPNRKSVAFLIIIHKMKESCIAKMTSTIDLSNKTQFDPTSKSISIQIHRSRHKKISEIRKTKLRNYRVYLNPASISEKIRPTLKWKLSQENALKHIGQYAPFKRKWHLRSQIVSFISWGLKPQSVQWMRVIKNCRKNKRKKKKEKSYNFLRLYTTCNPLFRYPPNTPLQYKDLNQ